MVMFPSFFTGVVRYLSLYPMQDIFAMTSFAVHGITKSPFSLLTPPVTNEESAGFNTCMFAYTTDSPFASTRCPLSFCFALSTHSTVMRLSLVVILMG